MKKVAKVTRVIMVAPIMALILCTLLLIIKKESFCNIYMYFICLLCLGIIPSLSYVVEKRFHICSKANPNLSNRDSERRLAIYMSEFSYALLTIIVFITKQSDLLKEMTLTYLFSGLFMLIFMLLKINTSGHTCGFIGPVVFLSYSISIWFLLALPLLYFVIWSSLKLKRHTLFELISGCLIPVVSFLLAILII